MYFKNSDVPNANKFEQMIPENGTSSFNLQEMSVFYVYAWDTISRIPLHASK